MIVAGATRTNGPKSVKNGVHIIFVEAEPSTCHNPDESTSDAGLDEAAKLVTWAQPTDVVVFDRKPWHYVDNKLRAHPKVHDDYPETILELSISRGDRAVWFSEVRFDITKIELSHHHGSGGSAGSGHPADPSASPYPFSARVVTDAEIDGDGHTIWVARSTVPVPRSVNHMYKISFTIQGMLIDPDMSCVP